MSTNKFLLYLYSKPLSLKNLQLLLQFKKSDKETLVTICKRQYVVLMSFYIFLNEVICFWKNDLILITQTGSGFIHGLSYVKVSYMIWCERSFHFIIHPKMCWGTLSFMEMKTISSKLSKCIFKSTLIKFFFLLN